MRLRRAIALLAACATLGGGVALAQAERPPLTTAEKRSERFAKRTCAQDGFCVRSGVRSCHRRAPRLAFCRIFIWRDTAAQGTYECSRLVRLALRGERRSRITGLGAWNC